MIYTRAEGQLVACFNFLIFSFVCVCVCVYLFYLCSYLFTNLFIIILHSENGDTIADVANN